MNLLTIVIFVRLGMLGLFVALVWTIERAPTPSTRSEQELRSWLGLAANTPASIARHRADRGHWSHLTRRLQGTTADVRILLDG